MLNIIQKHYQSAQVMYGDLKQAARKEVNVNRLSGKEWWGVSSGQKVIDMSGEGWPEGRERALKCIEKVELPKVHSTKRFRVSKDFGDEVNMQRVWMGNYDRAWSTTRRKIKLGKNLQPITLLVNVGGNANRHAREYFWRGAVAVVLADIISSAGRSVQIITYEYSKMAFVDRRDYCGSVVIKKANDRLNLEQVAYQTALAGFDRVWVFASTRQEAKRKGTKESRGLGRDIPALSTVRECVPDAKEAFIIWGIWDECAANQFVKNTVDTLNERMKK